MDTRQSVGEQGVAGSSRVGSRVGEQGGGAGWGSREQVGGWGLAYMAD